MAIATARDSREQASGLAEIAPSDSGHWQDRKFRRKFGQYASGEIERGQVQKDSLQVFLRRATSEQFDAAERAEHLRQRGSDQRQKTHRVAHKNKAVPEIVARVQIARHFERRLFPEAANLVDLSERVMSGRDRRAGFYPAIFGLGSVRSNSEQNDKLRCKLRCAQGVGNVAHEHEIVADIVIRRKYRHGALVSVLYQVEQCAQDGGSGTPILRLNDRPDGSAIREHRGVKSLMRAVQDHHRLRGWDDNRGAAHRAVEQRLALEQWTELFGKMIAEDFSREGTQSISISARQ